MTAYGTSIVRRARPESEWIDITTFGATGPTYIEKWRGWVVDLWCFWDWDE